MSQARSSCQGCGWVFADRLSATAAATKATVAAAATVAAPGCQPEQLEFPVTSFVSATDVAAAARGLWRSRKEI